jgi:hypothetical protein
MKKILLALATQRKMILSLDTVNNEMRVNNTFFYFYYYFFKSRAGL